ncbi:hypothetical protein ABVB69_37650 [Streptomyces sp. NPDC000349]|uniref:hypothetical protein n=1 Tax=Streptomyces sp. NPDC000349 TaxID=3154249 RepID=UPI00336A1B4C
MTMTPQEFEDQKETLELISSELAARLTRQSESGAKVDTKAIFLVGFAATAAQFLASRSFEPFTGAAAFVAYAVAVGFGISVFNLAEYEDRSRGKSWTPTHARRRARRWGLWQERVWGCSRRTPACTSGRRSDGRSPWPLSPQGSSSPLSVSCCTLAAMTDTQNQGNPPPPPPPPPPPSLTDSLANPTLVGTEKRNEGRPARNRAATPGQPVERR